MWTHMGCYCEFQASSFNWILQLSTVQTVSWTFSQPTAAGTEACLIKPYIFAYIYIDEAVRTIIWLYGLYRLKISLVRTARYSADNAKKRPCLQWLKCHSKWQQALCFECRQIRGLCAVGSMLFIVAHDWNPKGAVSFSCFYSCVTWTVSLPSSADLEIPEKFSSIAVKLEWGWPAPHHLQHFHRGGQRSAWWGTHTIHCVLRNSCALLKISPLPPLRNRSFQRAGTAWNSGSRQQFLLIESLSNPNICHQFLLCSFSSHLQYMCL